MNLRYETRESKPARTALVFATGLIVGATLMQQCNREHTLDERVQSAPIVQQNNLDQRPRMGTYTPRPASEDYR